MSFGKLLEEIRIKNGDSLRRLAEKTGIIFTKLYKIELGDIAVAEDTLNKFIEAYPLYKNILVEAYIKEKLPQNIYTMLKVKENDDDFKENKSKIIYDTIFKGLEADEQKEILNNIYEKLVYFSVKKNNYEEKKEKLSEIKKAIEEL